MILIYIIALLFMHSSKALTNCKLRKHSTL